MKKSLLSIYLISMLVIGATTSFSTRAESNVGYFGFEPDIITNYIGQGNKKLGYVRITDLMLNDISDIGVVEHHTPLLRDAIVEILSKEPEENISRSRAEKKLKALYRKTQSTVKTGTGQEIVREVLFTKYLYH